MEELEEPSKNGQPKDISFYRHRLSAYSGGHFWLFPEDFLDLMSRDEALVLSAIINFADQFNAISRYKGWFFLSIDRLKNKVRMDARTQQRNIKRLVERGYLKSKRVGFPPKRFFLVVTEKLDEDVVKARENAENIRKKLKRQKYKKFKNKILSGTTCTRENE